MMYNLTVEHSILYVKYNRYVGFSIYLTLSWTCQMDVLHCVAIIVSNNQ